MSAAVHEPGGVGRRLAFVTGTRADFGKMQPLAEAAARAGFDVAYFVTGMHMLRQYGDTRVEVRAQAAGDIYEFVNQSPGDEHDVVLAKTMQGFGDWIEEYPADLVVIHGDRVEALAIALTCAMRYIPCAHVEGGEVSGTIDELYRHCNSKLCRYHFVSSDAAARRVRLLGEHPNDVFVIGSPELDLHGSPASITLDEVRSHYDIGFAEYGIVVFHPVTSERDTIRGQAEKLFGALSSSGKNFVVIAPNNDPGCGDIFEVLDTLPLGRFRVIPSMRFAYFSTLMKHASAIVGNSSLGVREAPFLGVPSLNVGTRQHRRASSESIVDVAADDSETIRWFLNRHWGTTPAPSREFGSGNAGERFVEILSDPAFWSRPRQKAFYDEE
ncbi:MAG: UDP-N-acetylglucosamine 2-epimerase [Actinomycetota bacterium]